MIGGFSHWGSLVEWAFLEVTEQLNLVLDAVRKRYIRFSADTGIAQNRAIYDSYKWSNLVSKKVRSWTMS